MKRRSIHGYILVETTVAIVVLGISAITIHGVVRQAIQTRGQVQDFTQVRFLMEDYMARMELQPYMFTGTGDGVFESGDGRFAYTYSIRPVDVPVPALSAQPEIPVEERKQFAYVGSASRMVHVSLTVRWFRGDIEFEERIETLLPQGKLFVPPKAQSEEQDAA